MRFPGLSTWRLLSLGAIVSTVLGLSTWTDFGQASLREMDDEQMAKYLEQQAQYLDDLASTPAKESELPRALYEAGAWTRPEALEAELELLYQPSSRRWKQLSAEGRALAAKQAEIVRRRSAYRD